MNRRFAPAGISENRSSEWACNDSSRMTLSTQIYTPSFYEMKNPTSHLAG